MQLFFFTLYFLIIEDRCTIHFSYHCHINCFLFIHVAGKIYTQRPTSVSEKTQNLCHFFQGTLSFETQSFETCISAGNYLQIWCGHGGKVPVVERTRYSVLYIFHFADTVCMWITIRGPGGSLAWDLLCKSTTISVLQYI